MVENPSNEEGRRPIKRDPRVDPRPGDILRMAEGWKRYVTRRECDEVRFCASVGQTYLDEMRDSISDWEKQTASAQIIRIGVGRRSAAISSARPNHTSDAPRTGGGDAS